MKTPYTDQRIRELSDIRLANVLELIHAEPNGDPDLDVIAHKIILELSRRAAAEYRALYPESRT